MDPVMSLVLRAGSLSLRELFSRLGVGAAGRVVTLLKSGNLRLETSDGRQGPDAEELSRRDDDAVVDMLVSFHGSQDGEGLEVTPTVKALRNPAFTA